jgi:flagellar biogenesis protein FliO
MRSGMIGTNTDGRHRFGFPKLRRSSVLISGVLVIISSGMMSSRLPASDRASSQWSSSPQLADEQTVTATESSDTEIISPAVSDSDVSEHREEVLPTRRVRKNLRTVAQAAFSAEAETVLRPVTSEIEVNSEIQPVASSEVPQTTVAAQGAKAFIDLSGPAESLAAVASPSAVTASTMDQVRLGAWMLILFCGMVLAVLAMRRWKRNQGPLPATGKTSRVVETLSLGPGRSVSLIEIAGMRALVGADAGGIRTIVMAPRTFDDEIRDNDFEDFPARETLSERSTALQR